MREGSYEKCCLVGHYRMKLLKYLLARQALAVLQAGWYRKADEKFYK